MSLLYTCLNFDVRRAPHRTFPLTAEESGAGKQILLEKDVCVL
jgi:hypothetical protein